MANWAWPHTPADNFARLLLVGGPFDNEEAGFLPPDTAAPVQVVWSGWTRHGPDAVLYQWDGETTTDRGRTDALVFRPTGRHLGPDEIPPVMSEMADLWADGALMLVDVLDVPHEMVWPGL
jgi:hypothetical protein